jgi:hypothetical protein
MAFRKRFQGKILSSESLNFFLQYFLVGSKKITSKRQNSILFKILQIQNQRKYEKY